MIFFLASRNIFRRLHSKYHKIRPLWLRSFYVLAMLHSCRHSRCALLPLLTALAFLLCLAPAMAEPEVKIAVESQSVYLGETFVFQISVAADNEPEPPAFPKTADFQVESLGPRRNQSTSVSIINGRMTKTSVNETVFTYRLAATRTGALRIPPIPVKADGRVVRTQAVPVHVMAPEKMDDMALEVAVSSPECFVGQPVTVTWKWFIGRRVLDHRFNLPLLAEKNFSFPAYSPEIDPARRRDYRKIILASGAELIGILEQATRNGVPVSCLTFSQPLIPLQAGAFTFPASTVTFSIEDQNRAQRGRRQSIFDGFFDQTPTRTLTIAAPALVLNVKDLPSEGRPANFSGLVGPCRIEVSASPRQVSVGDPILLTVQVSGPEYLDNLRLPALAESPELSRDFRVSGEEPGVVENKRKVFQCTLRAVSAQVKAIPALRIPFFNPASGRYEEANSEPIALVVEEVRTITALDAQGLPTAFPANSGSELKTVAEGIAHNYGGDILLADQRAGLATWPKTPWKIAFGLAWPGVYLLALGAVAWRRRRDADPWAMAAQRAAGKCLTTLKRIQPDDPRGPDLTLAALTDFLAAKLRRPAAAAQSFQDVKVPLATAGITPPVLERLEKLFTGCEASRYAGATPEDLKQIPLEAATIVKTIDRAF